MPLPVTVNNTERAVVGDLNGDGWAEVLATTAVPAGGVLTYEIVTTLGGALSLAGTATLPLPTPGALPGGQGFIQATGDVNGDGFADALSVLGSTSNVWEFRVNVGGSAVVSSFGPATTRLVPPPPPSAGLAGVNSALLADVNADGLLDAVGVRYYPTEVNIVWAPGDATQVLGPVSNLITVPNLCCAADIEDIVFEDWTGDGLLDILIVRDDFLGGGFTPRDVWVEVLVGDGAGGFSSPIQSPIGVGLVSTPLLAAGLGDGDGDGDPDLFFVSNTNPTGTFRGVAVNASIIGQGCTGLGGSAAPSLFTGRAWPGHSGFSASVTGAAPNALSVLGLSTGLAPNGGPCGEPMIDLSPGSLLLPFAAPAPPYSIVNTDAAGSATIALPIPGYAFLSGVRVRAQWAVGDSSVALGYSMSAVRTIVIE